jgi:hypothetical protein
MIYEQRPLGADRVDTIRITLDTPPELIEQYAQDGYTEVMEHHLVLYKPPEKIVLKEKLDSIASELPDEIAVEHVDLYPVWMEGMTLGIGDRVQHNGGLYRVQQAHTAEHPPSVNTAALYTRIQSPGAVQAWVTGQSYAKDVQVTHNGKTWISMVDHNVWEPGAAGVYKSIWKEVIV